MNGNSGTAIDMYGRVFPGEPWTKKPVQVDTTVMCRRGHLRAEHSYTYPNGKRECRACRKHVNAEHLAERRAAREAAA